MLFTTPTQFAALALTFIAGWLFGLASHSGGRKWRDRYTAEREAHAATRQQADARLADANARQAELEREHQRLVRAAPVTAGTVMPASTTTTTTTTPARPLAAARPAYSAGEQRGWFDWGPRTTTRP